MPAVGYCRTAGVYSALRVDGDARCVGKNNARSAYGGERLAVFANACTDGSSRIIACAAHNDSALVESQFVSHSFCESACYLAGFVYLAQPVLVYLESAQQFVRPLSVGNIEQLHARSIGNFGGILMRQHEAQVVFRKKNMCDL